MKASKKVRLSNSMCFVMDSSIAEIPSGDGEQVVESTDSCVVIHTLTSADGETQISFYDARVDPLPASESVFDGEIAVESGRVTVSGVDEF
nr:hypothetical protein [Gemmatimonadota bacterium]